MDTKKLESFRKLLLEHRAKVMNRTAQRGLSPFQISRDDMVDENDHAAAIVQQGVSLEVQDRDRKLIIEIEHALSKFEVGMYGLCEDTEEPIDEARLETQPWTRYCVEAQEIRESQARRYARG